MKQRMTGTKKIMLAIGMLFMIIGFALPAVALPLAMEADKLLLSAADKMDSRDYTAAGQDLAKITALGIKLPVVYYYQNGRYLAATRQAADAKKNLEIYLDKAGKEGKFYSAALEVYSFVEANEKRWAVEKAEAEKRKAEAEKRLARFKNNGAGTVTDTQTGLMWASQDNGADINWPNARAYCENYNGGGHSDWRMPTQDELAGLYDRQESGYFKITPLIKLTSCCPWVSETRGSEATDFSFAIGERHWLRQSFDSYRRALPVRGGK
jgi:hypothetical protein